MNFSAYPAYKESGVKWLPKVPEHWDIRRNKQTFRIVSTLVGSKSKDFQLLSLTLRGVIPRDIESGKGKFPAEFDTYQTVEPDNVIFCLFDIDETPRTVGISSDYGMITGAYTVVRAFAVADPRFIYYYYFSIDLRKGLRPFYTGLRKVVRPETFMNIELPLPPRHEQANICNFLDHETARIDALIEEQQRLIELLKEKRQAVISHAVTKGLDPTVPMKDSNVEWLGEVPAHWELTRVGWQCIVGNGCTPARDNQNYWDDGHYPWLNSSKVNLERVIEADQFVTNQALKECALPIVKPGSVLMAITGEGKTRGMVTITEIEATINQHVAFIEPRGSTLLPTFLHDWLSANYSRLRHDSADWGSTKAAITCGDIRAYPLPLPPPAEQEAICQFVGSKSSLIDGLISSADENVSLLYERRSALISAAVTGKIDVRGWQPPASATSPELAQEAV